MNIQKYIPKQVHVPYIGAFLNLLGNVLFLFSIANFIMTTWIFYNLSEEHSKIHIIFPHFIYFFISYCIVGFLLCLLCWIFIIPSQNKFAQEQAVIEGRSPTYEKICEIERILNERGLK